MNNHANTLWFVGQMQKTSFILWPRKAVGCCEYSLMDHFSMSFEGSRTDWRSSPGSFRGKINHGQETVIAIFGVWDVAAF